MDKIYIIKKSGEKEIFSDEKIIKSMRRVGVSEELMPIALEEIKDHAYNNMPTSKIFAKILSFLKERDVKSSLKFSLKKAMFDLGPSGHPFEKYMHRIFESSGYNVAIDVILNGGCVSHEIDLVLEKENKKEIVEAKFHNLQGIKTDVQVMLYTYARFLDLKDKHNIDNVWVVTNTKLTEEAIAYGACKNIKMIAWNYPENQGLQKFIGDPKMYPITVLNTFTNDEKQRLLENNVILCSELLSLSDEHAKELSINPGRLQEAKQNARLISS